MLVESPVVSIRIPASLRPYVDGAEEVTVSGDTVAEALAALGHEHPQALAQIFRANGALHPDIDIYLRGLNIRNLDGLATELNSEEVLTVVTTKIDAATPIR